MLAPMLLSREEMKWRSEDPESGADQMQTVYPPWLGDERRVHEGVGVELTVPKTNLLYSVRAREKKKYVPNQANLTVLGIEYS